jgi:hypothetical protein
MMEHVQHRVYDVEGLNLMQKAVLWLFLSPIDTTLCDPFTNPAIGQAVPPVDILDHGCYEEIIPHDTLVEKLEM